MEAAARVSNHHTICCIECDPKGYCEMPTIDQANWVSEPFIWVVKHHGNLVALRAMTADAPAIEIEVKACWQSMDLEWLCKHLGHRLIVRDEYRQWYYGADGAKHDWEWPL